METVIIIVNWNGRHHLEICLKSALSQSLKAERVILVDNGSNDGSVEYVKKYWPGVKVISLAKNYGFAEGNNIGIREALKDPAVAFVCLLNNDTEATDSFLEEMHKILHSDSRAGAVCAKTLFFNRRNIIDGCGDFYYPGSLKVVTRGHGEVDNGQYDESSECLSARAAAVLYRRTMLEDIVWREQYFDRRFFAYIEDTDLSIRARLHGWKILFAPRSVVYHKVAATADNVSASFRRYYSGRNRIFTAVKNYPIVWWLPALRQPSKNIPEGNFGRARNFLIYLKIFTSLLLNLPYFLSQRRHMMKKKKVSKTEIFSWPEKFSWKSTK